MSKKLFCSFVFLLVLTVPPMAESEEAAPQAFLTLLYTGLSNAAIEPCQCSGLHLGGLGTRAREIERIREEGIPLLLLETGDAFASGTELDKVRTEFYMEMLDLMGYDALNVGTDDIVLGTEFLERVCTERRLMVLSSNLRIGDRQDLPWKGYLVKEIANRKIGVFGLLPAMPKVAGADNIFWADDPIKAARETVQLLKDQEQANVIILLSDVPREVEEEIVRSVQGINLLVSNNPGSPFGRIPESSTVCVTTPGQARKLGRLDLMFNEETGALGYKPQEILLQREVAEPVTSVSEEIQAFYDRILSEPRYRAKARNPMSDLPLEKSGDLEYMGAASCRECHPGEYRAWRVSLHYHAYKRLIKSDKYYHPECLGCHVTGLFSPGGFQKVEFDSNRAGVQCEQCHGPGSAHNINPEQAKLRVDKSREFCARCHTPEWTKDFSRKYKGYYDSYFPHVRTK